MDKQKAIKILKEFHDTSALFSVRTALETVFPELKENEDERIRKELIQYIKNWKANIQGKAYPYLWSSDKEECDKLLAWLEKQGKQKVSYTTIVETGDGGINALVTGELPIDGEQKPIEFKCSADDKNKLLIIEQILDCANLLISSQELTEIKNWLKSFEQRIGG